jgi:hypothetical protein
MTLADYIGFTVLALMIASCVWGYRSEKKLWNNGWCPDCNNIWRPFDMDSQGGRGYKCDCRHKHIWISWPGID